MGKYQSIAERWRDEQNEVIKKESGIVLIFNGTVYGWKNELRNPESEKPNAVAVDINGKVYVAEGGDSYNGAERWRELSRSPS